MRKKTKSNLIKICVIILIVAFALGGLASSIYYLAMESRWQAEYEAAFNEYLEEMMAAEATLSATASDSAQASTAGELLDNLQLEVNPNIDVIEQFIDK